MQDPQFWLDKENAKKVSETLARLKEEVEPIANIQEEIFGLTEFAALTDTDEKIAQELSVRMAELERRVSAQELKSFLSGPYDKNNAIITIYAGAGGVDAQDWADMLFRMYERYGVSKGYKVSILAKRAGEEKGIKEATLEIQGRYGYGYLKKENGVHRLVRISPFSAQHLRHTSFALVEVLPQFQGAEMIEIRPEDIEVQTFRSSGPGGQNVNKRETAVRVTHLKTGIVVECQGERLQGENKAKALLLLQAKLFAQKMREEKEKVEEIRGGFIPAEWGHQIRSYVLHPYKMVKDHRTGFETANPNAVLDGALDEFIEAAITT
jgi:peptide chain release factor 2